MVRLRHLHAKNLDELEKKIELLKFNPVIVNINNVNGTWFAHFLLQSIEQEIADTPIREEVVKPTETTFEKKIPKRKS